MTQLRLLHKLFTLEAFHYACEDSSNWINIEKVSSQLGANLIFMLTEFVARKLYLMGYWFEGLVFMRGN